MKTNQYALGYKAGLEAAVKVCREIYGDTERSRIISIVQRDIAALIAALPVPEVQLPDIEAAVLAEREACAKVCEEKFKACVFDDYRDACQDIRAAIRARGDK